MASIRSHLFKYYIKRRLRKAEAQSLLQRRSTMDKNIKRFKNAKGIAYQSVDVNGRPGEWLIPEHATTDAAVLYLHGGAYALGSLDSHRSLASHIAHASGTRVLAVDYRLAPEHPFPAALDDAVAAFNWIAQNTAIEPKRIIAMGDSAGGGLAIATALRLRDTNQPLPGAIICMSPWTNLNLDGPSVNQLMGKDPFFASTDHLHEAASQYAVDYALNHPEISPLFARLEGLPAIHVQVGELEILLSDSLDLVAAAQRAGVAATVDVWPGMWHVWQAFCDKMPESKKAIKELGARVKASLS
ncbi:alpha/beta hydrolase [Pseudomonas chlororaphis]|uniref:alpha/beta hydrolase n=1 Tax=Pseudomonas chlororaphis TaxID=587753 RepID=UPI00209F88AA|nr:alpha/beta hydrolase [Pseudomonas chlororaphis]MCP1479089.1 acetyl esterase/lipase [Pseudomonas chlororaphis]MCP1594559.1 acetyl esterase/lipase [Pseudomonas chlororaphis]WDG53599.1 alpha/beta hydrolase [Pseudomonas chlororaphis]WDH91200.1 alpha/beta hydrolase [Pseudomonas chlororaphis]